MVNVSKGYRSFLWPAVLFGFLISSIVLLKGVLLPFILGFAIAYLLNPLVNRLTRIGLSRSWASLFILLLFFLLLVLLFAVIAPVLYREASGFVDDLPVYLGKLLTVSKPFADKVQALLGIQNGKDITALATSQAGTGFGIVRETFQGVLSGGQALVNLISLVLFMPIISYFMMTEWVRITDWMKDLMPKDHKEKTLFLMEQIDRKLAGFVRGQISVAMILGLSYALALTLAGLKYGFLIGLVSGFLSIIPMVGSIAGLVSGVIVAWVQTGSWSFMLLIAGIFLIGQLIEGNFLTPKLVGNSVGLHPLWIFFALLAGGSLLGIVGMLLAVPVAVVVAVLGGFVISSYKDSEWYKGSKSQAPDSRNTQGHE